MAEQDPKGKDSQTPTEPIVGAVGTQTLTVEDVEKIVTMRVQPETDRVRTELYGKMKVKDTEIEELKKSKMSEAEIRKYKEEQLSLREQELRQKEMVIVATDSLRENNLPIDFRDLVIGTDVENTKAKVLILQKHFQAAVENAVADKFKAGGHEPGKGEPAKPNRTFTETDIAKMTKAEFAKNEPAIMAAMREGRIKKS